LDSTSKLSPYLHFGQLSVHEVFHKALEIASFLEIPQEDVTCFLSELGWREFSSYLLYHAPNSENESFTKKFQNFPWEFDQNLYDLWTKGKTGYPIVDAGMRQLWQTGWMHNRVRMIVASFLTKHLNHSWKCGENWFWDTLVDADIASNCFSWQWVAGCGADSAPYFRIFNPTLQGQKFDPEAQYIKKWVPELKYIPPELCHEPWKKTSSYYKPIVEHTFARSKALERFKNL
ncbi:MAG TPA: FAD-binding domain-containing protein, partial [Alphaproteobacteria bacterium]|nr:FAD-binding domain-containing protein [Alphaproteobacteria bacterium]